MSCTWTCACMQEEVVLEDPCQACHVVPRTCVLFTSIGVLVLTPPPGIQPRTQSILHHLPLYISDTTPRSRCLQHTQRQQACGTSICSSDMSSQADAHPSHLQLYAGLAYHTPLLTLHSFPPPPCSLATSMCREPLLMGQALCRAGSGDLERSCEMLSMGYKTL